MLFRRINLVGEDFCWVDVEIRSRLDPAYEYSDNDEIEEELINSADDDEEQSSDDFRGKVDFG